MKTYRPWKRLLAFLLVFVMTLSSAGMDQTVWAQETADSAQQSDSTQEQNTADVQTETDAAAEVQTAETAQSTETDAKQVSGTGDVLVQYTIEDEDGEAIKGASDGSFTFSDSVKLSDKAPAVDGYTFSGAYIGGNQVDTIYAADFASENGKAEVVFRYRENDNTKTDYTYEDDYIRAEAVLTDPAAVPADAVFKVTSLDAGFAHDAYLDALNQNAGADEFTEDNTLLYNIGFFVTEDGKEKEVDLAQGKVSISLSFKDQALTQLGAQSGKDVDVIHMPLKDKSAYDTAQEAVNITADDLVVDPVSDAEAQAGDGAQDSVSFTLDNLSITALSAPAVPRRAGENEAEKDLSEYISDNSVIQFRYYDSSTYNYYTVNYSLKDKSSWVTDDKGTKIQDKDGKDFNLYQLRSVKAMIAAEFKNDETITASDKYTYTLPSAADSGTTWTNGTYDLKGTDGTVYGTYTVSGNTITLRFNDTFINLDNRYATVTLSSTFSSTNLPDDSDISFVFPGIGTFYGHLKKPSTLSISKKISKAKVDENTSGEELKTIFENQSADSFDVSSSTEAKYFPYISLRDDGAYMVQILKITGTGTNNKTVITDRTYSGNLYYSSTIGLYKVSADGKTYTKLTQDTDYTLEKSGSYVYWKLRDPLQAGETVYVAYEIKHAHTAGYYSSGTSKMDDENGISMSERYVYSYLYNEAYADSDDAKEVEDDSYLYLYNNAVAKRCDELDTENHRAHWVIYVNLGPDYTRLDGNVVRDKATGGTLDPDNDTVNVYLVPASNENAENISASDFKSKAVQLIQNGSVINTQYGDWSGFNLSTLTSDSGYTIPSGTGYGALKIEYWTDYSNVATNARGNEAYIENTAYYKDYSIAGRQPVDITGLVVPAVFAKKGEFVDNTGLIKWTSTFSLDGEMKLSYRDLIGYGEKLEQDNLTEYPMTLTVNKTGSDEEVAVERYQEGVSDDPDKVYYKLTVYHDVDTKYRTSYVSYGKTDPSFRIDFVNSKGEETKLAAGNYTLTYYTYYSPFYADYVDYYDIYSSPYHNDSWYVEHQYDYYNNAWLVYNQEKNYMSASDSLEKRPYFIKGSDESATSETGQVKSIPEELQPKAADELFWYIQCDPLTETTSKIVIKDTLSLGNSSTYYDSELGSRYTYNDSMTLETDNFVVYNGDNKLTDYTLEATDNGFNLTITKDQGYDPTKKLTVYYKTKLPTDTMKQGDRKHYGNLATLYAYDSDGNEFPTSTHWYDGERQNYTYELLSKADDYDPSTGYIVYTVSVNPQKMTLNDGKTVELTDTMDSHLEYDVDADGNFIYPLQVLDENEQPLDSSQYSYTLTKNDDGTYGPLKITVPDGQHVYIKYRTRVKNGVSSIEDIEASNMIEFSTGTQNGVSDTDTVTLTNLSATAGGTPINVSVVKADSTNTSKLLDDAKFSVTTYLIQKGSDSTYTISLQDNVVEKTTENGIFSMKSSYNHIIAVQETQAPNLYLRDDSTVHYYIIARSQDGTKDDWKTRLSDSDLLGNDRGVDWDTQVTLLSSEYNKETFTDTPNTTSLTATKTWTAADGTTADTTDHKTVYLKLYRKASKADKSAEPKEVPETEAPVKSLTVASGESTGTVTWDNVAQYTDQDKSDTWVYSVKEVIKNDDDTYTDGVPDGYTKTEENLVVTNKRVEDTVYTHDSIKVTKSDAGGTGDSKISDSNKAVFGIYSDEDCTKEITTIEAGSTAATLSTDNAALASYLPTADKGTSTLYLKEKTAPKGYELNTTVHTISIVRNDTQAWTKNDKQQTVYRTTAVYTMTVDGSETIDVADSRTTRTDYVHDGVTFTKTDADDLDENGNAKPIGEDYKATFTVYSDQDCKNAVTTFQAGTYDLTTDNAALADYLPASGATANLYVKETAAPTGYKLPESSHVYKVSISRSDKTAWAENDSVYLTTVTYTMQADDQDAVSLSNDRIKDTVYVHDGITFTKTDKDDSNKAIGDDYKAEFTLYADADCTEKVTSFEAGTYKLTTDDEALKNYLPVENGGKTSLYLKETKAPSGYTADATVHSVTISRSDRTDWTTDHSSYRTTVTYKMETDGEDLDALNIGNDRVTGTKYVQDKITVTKLDADDLDENGDAKPIGDDYQAEFTLYADVDCTQKVTAFKAGSHELKTDDSDLADYLPADGQSVTLYLKETQAPEGYTADDSVHTVTISRSDSAEWTTLQTADGTEQRTYLTTVTYQMEADGEDTDKLNVSDSRITDTRYIHDTLTVTKTDADNPDEDGDAKPVGDEYQAEFTIYADEDCTQEIKSFRAGSTGLKTDDEAFAEYLPAADGEETTLYLKEVKAPAGYTADPEVHTLVISRSDSADWTMWAKNDGEEEQRTYLTTVTYSLKADNADADTLNVPNSRITKTVYEHSKFTVNKTDKNGSPLNGAEFTLYADEKCQTEIMQLHTNDGKAVISTDDASLAAYLPQIEEGKDNASAVYYLKETKAPDGYTSADKVYQVDLAAEQSIDWNEAHDAYVTTIVYTISSDQEDSVTVVNEKIVQKSTARNGNGPKTGDSAHMALWFILMVASLLTLYLSFRRRRIDQG